MNAASGGAMCFDGPGQAARMNVHHPRVDGRLENDPSCRPSVHIVKLI